MNEYRRAIEYFEKAHANMKKDGIEIPPEELAAIAALKDAAERENPKPLTLDELREMEGKPVWIENYERQHYSQWIILKTFGSEYAIFSGGGRWLVSDCAKTWIAYRAKPKEAPCI